LLKLHLFDSVFTIEWAKLWGSKRHSSAIHWVINYFKFNINLLVTWSAIVHGYFYSSQSDGQYMLVRPSFVVIRKKNYKAWGN